MLADTLRRQSQDTRPHDLGDGQVADACTGTGVVAGQAASRITEQGNHTHEGGLTHIREEEARRTPSGGIPAVEPTSVAMSMPAGTPWGATRFTSPAASRWTSSRRCWRKCARRCRRPAWNRRSSRSSTPIFGVVEEQNTEGDAQPGHRGQQAEGHQRGAENGSRRRHHRHRRREAGPPGREGDPVGPAVVLNVRCPTDPKGFGNL